jgi:hypothetical protein
MGKRGETGKYFYTENGMVFVECSIWVETETAVTNCGNQSFAKLKSHVLRRPTIRKK